MPWLDAGGRLSYIPATAKPLRVLADNANGQPGTELWSVTSKGAPSGAPNIDLGTTAQTTTTLVLNPNGTGGVAWNAPAGGGFSLVDLGVFNAVDLLNGPLVVFTPRAGQFVQIFGDARTAVAINANAATPAVKEGPVTISSVGNNEFQLGDTIIGNIWSAAGYASAPWISIRDGNHIIYLCLDTNTTPYNVIQLAPAWQANHAYVGPTMIAGPDGDYWSTPASGTSGGAIPDFAGNEGGTVADGGYSGAITAVSQGAKTFTVAGDQSAIIPPASSVVVTGSTGNDGTYTVVSAVFGAGSTVITVVEAIPDATADGSLADSADVITWTDEGAIPTQGSLHLYALVS